MNERNPHGEQEKWCLHFMGVCNNDDVYWGMPKENTFMNCGYLQSHLSEPHMKSVNHVANDWDQDIFVNNKNNSEKWQNTA